MTTVLKIVGQFRVKPGSAEAFAELVKTLDVDEYNCLELGQDGTVVLSIDEYNCLELGQDGTVVLSIDEATSHGSYREAIELLDQFVLDHSVLGAAVLQTGDTPADWALFGLDEDPGDQAKRDYFTWHRDIWQQQLDQLGAP